MVRGRPNAALRASVPPCREAGGGDGQVDGRAAWPPARCGCTEGTRHPRPYLEVRDRVQLKTHSISCGWSLGVLGSSLCMLKSRFLLDTAEVAGWILETQLRAQEGTQVTHGHTLMCLWDPLIASGGGQLQRCCSGLSRLADPGCRARGGGTRACVLSRPEDRDELRSQS